MNYIAELFALEFCEFQLNCFDCQRKKWKLKILGAYSSFFNSRKKTDQIKWHFCGKLFGYCSRIPSGFDLIFLWGFNIFLTFFCLEFSDGRKECQKNRELSRKNNLSWKFTFSLVKYTNWVYSKFYSTWSSFSTQLMHKISKIQ